MLCLEGSTFYSQEKKCGLTVICIFHFASIVLFFNVWDITEKSPRQRKPNSLKYTFLWSHSSTTMYFPFYPNSFNVFQWFVKFLLLFYRNDSCLLRDETCSAEKIACVPVVMWPAQLKLQKGKYQLQKDWNCPGVLKNLVQDDVSATSKSSNLQVYLILQFPSS